MEITITRMDLAELAAHAENKEPDEACAVLLGSKGRVSEVVFAENSAKSETEFAIPDAQLVEIYSDAEKKGMDVIGIFHSHPSSEAYPSETDRKFMETNPVVWIIYSGTDRNFRGYTLDSGIVEARILVE